VPECLRWQIHFHKSSQLVSKIEEC
jgi:hypothetical protein